MGWKTTVKVEGAARKVDQIMKFNKDIWREMQGDIKSAGEEVALFTRQQLPARGLRNWGSWTEFRRGKDLDYDADIVQKVTVGVRSRKQSGFRRVKARIGFSRGNAIGPIYSLTGSRRNHNPFWPERSANFRSAMIQAHGGSVGTRNSQTWPRALTPAYYAKGPNAAKAIGQAVERAIAKINS